jgi:hypothetical protein
MPGVVLSGEHTPHATLKSYAGLKQEGWCHKFSGRHGTNNALLPVDPAGEWRRVCCTSGLGSSMACWWAIVCLQSRVQTRLYAVVPDLYMPCRMGVLVYSSQGIIYRYKVAMVAL